MKWKEWNELPKQMKTEEVFPYYEILKKKRKSLYLKRLFDIFISFSIICIFMPVFIFISILIKLDSKGPIFFRQKRVTQYGKIFFIYKFRTMIDNADQIGSQVTTENDIRITKIGRILRKYRLDEVPQVFNILLGEMTLVGTRPEVPKYVSKYSKEMWATLLLPAGVTSYASIAYKDEEKLLKNVDTVDKVYLEKVLPEKMQYNLKAIKEFGIVRDFMIMIKTIIAVVR